MTQPLGTIREIVHTETRSSKNPKKLATSHVDPGAAGGNQGGWKLR